MRTEREQKQPSLLAHFWEDDTPFPSPADSLASLLWGITGKNPSAPFGNCILSALWNWSIGPNTAAAPCSSQPESHICATRSSSAFFVALDDLSSGLSSFPLQPLLLLGLLQEANYFLTTYFLPRKSSVCSCFNGN